MNNLFWNSYGEDTYAEEELMKSEQRKRIVIQHANDINETYRKVFIRNISLI